MNRNLGLRRLPKYLPAPLRQMVRFALVGVINATIDIGLFWLLQGPLGVPYLIANGLSYSAGTTNSFLLNKVWTFADTRRQGQVLLQFPIFVTVNVVSLGLSSIILWALSEPLGVMPAKLVTTAVTFVFNFWASRTFVYRNK